MTLQPLVKYENNNISIIQLRIQRTSEVSRLRSLTHSLSLSLCDSVFCRVCLCMKQASASPVSSSALPDVCHNSEPKSPAVPSNNSEAASDVAPSSSALPGSSNGTATATDQPQAGAVSLASDSTEGPDLESKIVGVAMPTVPTEDSEESNQVEPAGLATVAGAGLPSGKESPPAAEISHGAFAATTNDAPEKSEAERTQLRNNGDSAAGTVLLPNAAPMATSPSTSTLDLTQSNSLVDEHRPSAGAVLIQAPPQAEERPAFVAASGAASPTLAHAHAPQSAESTLYYIYNATMNLLPLESPLYHDNYPGMLMCANEHTFAAAPPPLLPRSAPAEVVHPARPYTILWHMDEEKRAALAESNEINHQGEMCPLLPYWCLTSNAGARAATGVPCAATAALLADGRSLIRHEPNNDHDLVQLVQILSDMRKLPREEFTGAAADTSSVSSGGRSSPQVSANTGASSMQTVLIQQYQNRYAFMLCIAYAARLRRFSEVCLILAHCLCACNFFFCFQPPVVEAARPRESHQLVAPIS
jgi:hypothetical protein